MKPNDHILFFGDSITDAGRDRENSTNTGLGKGYAMLSSAALSARYPEWNLSFTNKGISGNRIYDLETRLQEDVLSLQPDLVSILIGINDTWHSHKHGKPSPLDEFTAAYHRVLTSLRENGNPTLVICEPFLLPIPKDRRVWRPDLDSRITICRELAREFGANYLPLDGIFAAAACRQTLDYWLPDGVHPSLAGHALIADHWTKLVTAA
jgi:lysophospholipase L1-like esterase